MPVYKRNTRPRKVTRPTRKAPRRRRNPIMNLGEYEGLEEFQRPIDTGALGIPRDPAQAFELGRLNGLKKGLDLCKITNFYKRYKLKKKLQSELNRWFDDLGRQVAAMQSGVIGARAPMLGFGDAGLPTTKKKK